MGLILLFIAINDKPNKLATLLVVLVMTSAEKTLFYSNKTHSVIVQLDWWLLIRFVML